MKLAFKIIVVLLVLSNTIGILWVNRKVEKVVTIDIVEVFDKFKMKKDLEARVEKKLNSYKDIIDSLNAVVGAAENKKNSAGIDSAKQTIAFAQSEMQKAYEISNKTINDQVWTRLNALLKEYGKQNGYRLMIGSNGMGTVLYCDDAINQTQEFLSFINKKYANSEN